MTDDDLDEVMTSDLIDALKRRYDGVLVVVVKKLDVNREEREVLWRGGFIQAIGLVEWGRKNIRNRILKEDE